MARFLIVEARFYEHLNDMLIEGASDALAAAGHSVDKLTVPGALELPSRLEWLSGVRPITLKSLPGKARGASWR
jgi:6,7-dimethyl-8-ribityllumazine synthase